MFSAFFTGFFLGLSLIVAIGAQNAFVLRQGIIRHHVFSILFFVQCQMPYLLSLALEESHISLMILYMNIQKLFLE